MGYKWWGIDWTNNRQSLSEMNIVLEGVLILTGLGTIVWSGERYRGLDRTDNTVIRRVGIRFFTWLINMLTKSRITDCTNGYRAIRGSEIENLTLTGERFSAPKLIIEARKQGLRIKEVPIVIEERENSEMKKPSLVYAVGLARTILAT